jgi:Rho-binding antiterminator
MNYRLVDCGFHDQLEALATLQQPCSIVYRNEDDEVITITSQIADVYAADHADFIKLKDDTVIRLDNLVSVNDTPIAFAKGEAST